jgi:hypothetical protein
VVATLAAKLDKVLREVFFFVPCYNRVDAFFPEFVLDAFFYNADFSFLQFGHS